MTGALGNDARSDQDIVIATLRLNYGRVRAIPNPCAIYTIFTPNANVANEPVIWDPRTPPPPPAPFGDDRGIHFLCKWKQVDSPLPGAKVNGELPRPNMTHTHNTPLKILQL